MSKKLIVNPQPFIADSDNARLKLDTGAVISRVGGPGICSGCNEAHELKPAGPAGELVCLECARKNPQALRAFARRWVGVG